LHLPLSVMSQDQEFDKIDATAIADKVPMVKLHAHVHSLEFPNAVWCWLNDPEVQCLDS
jgi:hypothetical protein